MKKIVISSTAVTALVAGLVLLAPRSASASTPVETLNKMRAALAAAVRSGELAITATADKSGTVTVSGTLDGAPLPDGFPMTVEVTRDGNVSDVHVTVDMTADQFASVRYGSNEQTLELVPKKSPNTKFQIGLDSKSMQPKSWTTLVSDGTSWKTKSQRIYKPTAKSAPLKSTEKIADVRIRIMNGQDGMISVKGG